MADECCVDNNANFGTPECITDLAPIVNTYFQRTFKDDGTRNEIALSGLYAPIISGLLTALEESRLYPLGELVNVELPIADSKTEEAANGKLKWLRSGKRSFSAELWEGISTWITKRKLASKRCGKWSFYLVDANNKLVGSTDGTNFFGIPMDSQSVDPKFMFPTDSTGQKNMLNFDFDINFDDGTLYSIDGAKLTDVSGASSLIDFVNPFVSIIDCNIVVDPTFGLTATSATFNINDDYRQNSRTAFNSLGNVTGLLLGDMALFNKTTGLSVTISAVSENSEGQYTITFSAQTAGDVVEYSLFPAGNLRIEYAGKLEYIAI